MVNKSKQPQLSYFEFLDTVKVIRMLYNKECARDFYVVNSKNFGIDIKHTFVKDSNGEYIYKTSKD